ncbi:MAG: toxin-antitoxin system YwqK family antitoxin [Kofleriaceae bacterium]
MRVVRCLLPTDAMHADPHKPTSLPTAAYWEQKDNEWIVAERNASGQLHGLVTYYRPDGTRCCATEHRNGTPHGVFTRYHENQEPSRTGRFVDGVLQGTNVFTRSTSKTTEDFPAGLGAQIWRCEMDFVDGKTTDGRLYDREDRRVIEDGTPFPTQRPEGVAASAHFKKDDDGDYGWVEGSTAEIEGTWVKVGTWRWWTSDGALVRTERYEAGVRQFDRPPSVPTAAVLDEEDQVWVLAVSGDGDTKRWDLEGVLRHVETRERGELVRLREYLSDGSIGQDSMLFDDGVPRSKYFRRVPDEELQSFPNVSQDDAREVQYLFDEHGMMTSFRILGDAGAVLEEKQLYRNARNDTDQTRFPSIEAAAEAWTTEGDRYTRELNRWLAEMYASEDGEVSFEEPVFDRQDLERAVIEGVAGLNADGKRGRELFPLYHDGVGAAFWDRFGLVVDAVLDSGNGTTLARVIHPSRGPMVMRITPTAVTPVPGLLAFGASHDKRTHAYAFEDRIELHRGTESVTIGYPTSYQHATFDAFNSLASSSGAKLGVRALRIAESGREVVLVATAGIFVLSHGRQQRLYPLDATLDEYAAEHDPDNGPLEIAMHFANADISPAGDRITCGGLFRRGIMAGLAIYRREDHRWFLENTSQDDAFFPAQAVFHATKPHVAYAACLYASLSNRLTNTTFRIDLDGLVAGGIENFDGGIAQEPGRVQVIASFGEGFLLGFDNGYVRWMGTAENLQLLGYIFVGGSVLAIDVSADQRSFTVATNAGVVSRFSLAEKPARNLIASIPLSDDARTCFFRTFSPLRW